MVPAMLPTSQDMPQRLREMLAHRTGGRADPAIPRHLQRILFDMDVFARSVVDGITSPAVPIVETFVVQVKDGAFRVRLFAPHREHLLPLVLHMHGGAFVLGSIDWPDVDAKCRQLCLDAQCIVLTVDYRLAPEHRFPSQLEDCYAALQWSVFNADKLGVDTSRIAVMGESAGGNLAAVLAMMVRDRKGPRLCAQILEVPLVDLKTPQMHESHRLFASGFGLEAKASITANIPLYCTPIQAAQHYASPLHAEDVSGLAPALVMTAGFDILRDSGSRYAEKLDKAGVLLGHYHGTDQNHGSMALFQTWPPATKWFDHIVKTLRSVFVQT